MSDLQVNRFDIVRSSFVDGPGIRTTVFFKGCNLRCAWCHNPESQAPVRQLMLYAEKCVQCGKCLQVCPHGLQACDLCGRCAERCPAEARRLCGRSASVDEILATVLKDKSFYAASGGGVTCSGGECMLQIDALKALLQACRAEGIHTAVDTAGHVPFERFEAILPDTDLFLYDVKCYDAARHKQYVGEDNRLILENLARLLERGASVWVRIPVVVGVNDSRAEMESIRDFLRAHGGAERVDLLPYHAMGEHKYGALSMPMQAFSPPTEEQLADLRAVFA